MPLQLPCGPILTAEAALSSATGTYGVWDSSKWDQAKWGPDVDWKDISVYCRSLSTDRRMSRNLQVWESGTASAVLSNRDRRFSPDNLAGPYVAGGVTGVRPWRPMRFRATWKGVTYDLYNGYALSWKESWVGGHADSVVTVPCSDELARLAAFNGLEQPAQGAGETSGRRIHRVLNNAGHTGPRNVAQGVVTLQATTLSQDAVSELKLVTDSEGGALFVDGDGTIVFEDRNALVEQSRSNTIQATFGDGSGSELPCAEMALEYNGDLVANIASFARVGSTAQTVVNNTSQALYGPRRSTRTDLLCETDAQVLALAQFYVDRYANPELRITQIKVKPLKDPDRLWPQVLGRRIRDQVRAVARPIGGGTVVQDCHIAGIHHDITGDDWVTTFDLWSADFFDAFARWDAAQWDASKWFY